MTKLFQNRFLLGLIVLHLVFFITKLLIGNIFYIIDSYEYYDLAKNILSSGEFYHGNLKEAIAPSKYTRRPPLYGIFVLLTSFFTISITGTLIAQNVLSIFSICLIKKVLEENNFTVNNLYLFIGIATSFNQFIHINLVMSEIFLQFLIVLLVYQLHRTIIKSSTKNIILYQFVVILLFLTKPVFYLFVIPNLAITFFLYRKGKMKPITISSALLPIIALVIYCFWNYKRTGSYEFSSIQNYNLIEWNLKYFHINKYGQEKANEIYNTISEKSNVISNYSDRQHFIQSEVISYLKEDLIDYGRFHVKGCMRLFIDPGRFDLFSFFDIPEKPGTGFLYHINKSGLKGILLVLQEQPIFILCMLVMILTFNCIKLVSFVFFCFNRRKQFNLLIVTSLFIILYIAILTGPMGTSRYFTPLVPLYVSFAVIGFSDLIEKIKQKRKAIVPKHL